MGKVYRLFILNSKLKFIWLWLNLWYWALWIVYIIIFLLFNLSYFFSLIQSVLLQWHVLVFIIFYSLSSHIWILCLILDLLIIRLALIWSILILNNLIVVHLRSFDSSISLFTVHLVRWDRNLRRIWDLILWSLSFDRWFLSLCGLIQ